MTAARRTIALSALTLGALAPAVHAAPVTEIGGFDAAVKGSCPAKPCNVLSRTTGFQAKVGDQRGLMAAPADGRLVAFTVALGKPGKKQTQFFADQKLGATPSVQLTVLDPGKKLQFRTVAQSGSVDPTPFFGTTATFPLGRTLQIRKGQLVGITTTSWVPLMQLAQPSTSSWRASRDKGTCDDFVTQRSQAARQGSRYYCLYRGVRLAYSATFIPDPVKPTR